MNLADIGQTEDALIHSCRNAHEVAARVIPFLQTKIEETPITTQLQITPDLAIKRMLLRSKGRPPQRPASSSLRLFCNCAFCQKW